MATEKTLALRSIQPRLRFGGLVGINPNRRHMKAEAKRLRVSVRRVKRMQRR